MKLDFSTFSEMLISGKTFPLGFHKLVFSKHCDLDPKKANIFNFSLMNFQTVSLLAWFVKRKKTTSSS